MIKRSLWILALTAALAACSSGVKLSEVPVEDKNASACGLPPQPMPHKAASRLLWAAKRVHKVWRQLA
jgi:hypothetical protein